MTERNRGHFLKKLPILAIFRLKGEAFIRETRENRKNHVFDHKIVNSKAFLKI